MGMATWTEFESAAPELGQAATRLWPGIAALDRSEPLGEGVPWFAIAYLATVRRDGAPRLHPFCPILASGCLVAASPTRRRRVGTFADPRCVIHALPGRDDDELCIRARAIEVTDDRSIRSLLRGVVVRTGVGGMIESVSNDPLFEVDLEQIDVAHWLDIGQPGTRAVRSQWRPN
jgi:hypothetical protein